MFCPAGEKAQYTARIVFSRSAGIAVDPGQIFRMDVTASTLFAVVAHGAVAEVGEYTCVQ